MAVKRDKPELLAPAGDMERLKMAVLYGADAVYLAGTSFGMRAFAGNFSDEALPQAVAFAHSHGVRVHCTINTMPRNDEAARLPEHLERLADAGVKNIVCTQPFGCLPNHICGKGMMKPIKEKIPGVNIVAIDYDPGTTAVNQENRLKLMLAQARMGR